MKTDYLCVDASRIDLRKDNELSWLINSEYPESPVSSFLALLTTVVYRNSYNEAFSLPLYSYINKSGLETLAEYFVQQSFTFDSNINPTLPELSRAIASTLASSASAKTQSNYDEIAGIIVCLSEKPLSQEMLDAAEALHNQTNSELTCLVTNTDESIEISFLTSNSSRYQRIPEYLCNLANAVGKNPHQCIHNFNILSPEEIQQQLVFGRGEKVSLPDRHVYKNIEAFAVETPQAIAASCGKEQLTYSELNHQANQLAHFMRQFPVEIGDKVVAFLERSTDIVKAIFAMHKVGAVYVPIDPAFPKERIRAILTEVNPKLILTNSDAETVLEDIDIPRLNLKNAGEMLDAFPSTNPEINFQIESESHIFFTSGTTGKPKGVVATHRNLVQYLSSAVNRYKFSREDKFISAARFTFSINLFKILTPLYVGGSVRIIPREVVLNLPQLCQELQQATVFHFGPSLLKQLLPYIEENFPDFSLFNQLRHVSSGGDMVPPEVLEKLKQIFVNAEVYVIYGSSEISCMGCTYEVSRDITLVRTKVGKPHQNMSVRLFDKHGNMVPIGAPGKLYFSGDGLVKGYLHQEQLTAEKFTQIDGDRFYSIGDVGRFDTEGNIELLGRDDFQVQVRGMRVELPEIEYYLKKFPAISDCVVVSKVIQKNLDKSLVAYLVFQENFDANDSEIRKYLNQYLPDYSIPNIFVKLDRIPTNLNGKIDRSALPDPEINKNKDLVKPRNELESSIANIWEDVLGFEVGINQDFTSLGGHSLKAVQVISRIKKICSVELPLRYIFESTTVAELAQIIEKLPQTLENPPKSIIKPRSENAKLFLSFAQERIWFLNQLEGESAAYNIPLAWRIKGQLSINILELALKEIVRRHEILRTKFISENGSPVQVVVSNIPNILSVVDLQQLPKSEQEIEVQRLLKQEVETSFNLECVPLLRVKLLQLDKQAYVLIFNVHHIVFDAWSTGIFWKELLALYQAFESGQSSPLAELPIQYADYVLWQREWFESMLLEKQLKYWQKKLADAPPLLELPYDRPRPSVQTFTGQNQSLILSQSLSQAIKKLSQQEGLTVFMTLLAAFKLLLSRLSGSKDIAIGTPIASRNRLEIEQIIGFFINTVVLRTDLNGDLTVQELLGRVREVTLEAYENQAMPFERLVQELKPERSQSYNPLFQIWFNFLNLENMELEFSGLKAEVMPIKDPLAKFDLNLYIEEGQQRIKLNWVYNADLFDAVRIQEILNQYQYILEQIVTNPQAKIDNLSLVTQQSEKRLPSPIKPLNNELGEMIHTRFSQQSQIHPEKLAIVDANSSFTYAELEERSNQLANYLLANGINNQDVIAIYANRSVNLVWVLLGIMKAGGAFMILDPAYPTTRLIDCLQIAKPSGWIELEETNHNGKLQKFVNGLSCVCSLHVTSTLSLDGISSNAPNITINPDDLAYVAFTSGSTGKPKGIKGSHKPLSHFIKWHGQQFKFHELDRFSLLSGLSHDPLLRDIFTPLCLGATLYIPEAQDIQTPGALAHWMQQQLISVSHLTPAMAELLSESSLRIPSLRYVFFGGDILTQSDVIRMKKLAPNAICVNFYGTTETPQAMGYFVVPELGKLTNNESINFKQSIPLGQGIEDVQLLILNQNQQLAGIGELGEIYVRTLYLAQGYLGAQKLTQERFIVNPFTNIEGDRLYKTGDLARYLPDGNIEYVGRIDRQVKIRGFRIELGEIEGVLLQNTQIREAVVIAREDILGSKHLVAYMVTGETVLPVSELRSFLKTKLPDYMVPSAFITLESLPLTPNGKIDRRELPAPKIQPNSETTFVKPRDDVELRLNQIWQKVLGVSSIGVKNNFFDLGGHSLVAVRLFAEIERAFGKSLPLATLFQAPTIEELANICRDRGWTAPWRSLVTIQPQGSKPPLFFVHGIYGNVLYFRELADYLGSDQPFYGLQAKGLDGKETPYTSLEEMADHYVQEIREFQPTGPYFIGGHSFGCIVAFEVAQQLYAQGQEVALLALLDQAVSRNIQVPLWDWLSGHVKNLLSLGYPEQVAYVVGRLQAKIQHKIPQQIRQFYKNLGDKEVAEHKERFNTVMQANIQAINDYELQVYPGKVTLFRAKIGSPRRYALDPIGGWGEFALGGVDAIDVPGDHMTLIKEPHLPVLAAELKACLDKAQDNKFNE